MAFLDLTPVSLAARRPLSASRKVNPALVREGYPVRALVRLPERAAWMQPLGVRLHADAIPRGRAAHAGVVSGARPDAATLVGARARGGNAPVG